MTKTWFARSGLEVLIPGYPETNIHQLERYATMSSTLLWIMAVIIAIVGIVQLVQGQILLGIVLIVAACLVGPGGYSIFRGRTRHPV